MMTRRVSMHDASKFREMIRHMIQQETQYLQVHKLPGVVDYITASGSKYFADVFLNGHSPKFQDAFADFSKWSTVAGSFTVSGGIATAGATSNDLAIVTGSSYSDLTYVCQVNMPAISSTQETEIIIRYQDASNYYALVFANNTVLLRLVKAGAATTLASVAVTCATGTWYWLRIQAQGSRLTGWTSTDGITWSNQIQATDATFTQGSVGIRDISETAQYKLPTVYSGVTPSVPVRPGIGSTLAIGNEVWVEKVNFNGSDLLVDMVRVVSFGNADYPATFEFAQSFSFPNPASNQYAFIARLPPSSNATYDHLRVEIIGTNWIAPNNMVNDWVLFSNRNGFTYQYMQQGSGTRTTAGVQAFSNSDGTVDVYCVGMSGGIYSAITIKAIGMDIVQNPPMTPGTITATAPTGTLVFDSTTAAANATITHG